MMQKTYDRHEPSDRAISRYGEGERRLREIAKTGTSIAERNGQVLVGLYKHSQGNDEYDRVRSLARELGITLREQVVGATPDWLEVRAQIPRKP